MFERQQLPSWREIFQRIGEPEPRHNRARCPIHNGDSHTSLSINEGKGVFHCFVCGASGDKFALIMAVLQTDFPGALRWLGLEPGKPPKPDPAIVRRNAAMDQVRQWVRATGRRLRDEYRNRQQIIQKAQERLKLNQQDAIAWELLRVAYNGEAECEFLLSEIDMRRDDDERLIAWRKYRNEF